MKYLVKIHYEDTVDAESADEAVDAVFKDLDSQSNMSLTTTLTEYHTTVEPLSTYDRVSQKPVSDEDFEDKQVEEGFCPHCDVKLVSKIFDVDGTNLEEHMICPECGYGTPALR